MREVTGREATGAENGGFGVRGVRPETFPPLPPIVVIPVHKPAPNAAERVSLRRCAEILKAWEILFLAPQRLDLGPYEECIRNANRLAAPDGCMASLAAYNKLMISPRIFDALSGYSHMLLHEPDAIVLRDELALWCAKDFDYIGAPWFEGYARADAQAAPIGVGNSGFSLQRIDAARRALAGDARWYPWGRIRCDLRNAIRGNVKLFARAARAAGASGRLGAAHRLFDGPCDIFWARVVAGVDPRYRVAPIGEALRFAWEVQPAICQRLANGAPPFGIHAWAKYDPGFTMPLLQSAGVDLSELQGPTADRI